MRAASPSHLTIICLIIVKICEVHIMWGSSMCNVSSRYFRSFIVSSMPAPCPVYFKRFISHSSNIKWRIQCMKSFFFLVMCNFIHSRIISSLLHPDILLSILFSNTRSQLPFANGPCHDGWGSIRRVQFSCPTALTYGAVFLTAPRSKCWQTSRLWHLIPNHIYQMISSNVWY